MPASRSASPKRVLPHDDDPLGSVGMLELCPEFVLSDFGTLGFLGLLDKIMFV